MLTSTPTASTASRYASLVNWLPWSVLEMMARKLNPEIVVMDIALPRLNGFEATRQIHRTHPEIKILILTAHDDDPYVQQMVLLRASGFLLKQTDSGTLVTAIRSVHRGNTFVSPLLLERMEQGYRASIGRNVPRWGERNHPSCREIEVLQLIAEGQPNKLIAEELGVSIKTVDKQRQSLMRKLNIHDVAGLTRYAVSHAVIESSVRLTIL